MTTLATIIVNYNDTTNLFECLTSLSKLDWRGKHLIIVVDNSSTDQTSFISRKFPQVKVIRNATNAGFAAANNQGADYALKHSADLVMLLNSDTIIDRTAVKHLYQAINQGADIAVPKIYFYPNFEFHHSRYKEADRGKVVWYAGGHIDWDNIMGIHHGVDAVDNGQFAENQVVEFATGCCMMITRKVIDTIGLFDPNYYLYLEDADFSVRAKRAGFTLRYTPNAIVWHKNAQSSGGSGSSLQAYYFTRNRLLFGFKYASVRTRFALWRESLKLFFKGDHWQKRGVLDFYLHKFGKGSYAN